MHRTSRLLIWLFVALCPAGTSWACSCVVPSTGCHPLTIHGAMFLGEVLSVRHDSVNTAKDWPPIRSNVFRFRVIETFAGNQRSGDEVEVRTGLGGGDCGYSFVAGQRYLVDAYDAGSESSVRLATGICSATAPEDRAGIELTELRARASGNRVPDLNGQVRTVEGIGEPGSGESQPLAGVKVTLTSLPEGVNYHAVTDHSGIYTLPALSPGSYRVDFDLPSNRALWESEGGKPLLITIPEAGGTGAGCHVSVHAAPAGNVGGQIMNADGKGLKGFVAAYPIAQADSRSWAAACVTDSEGHFQLDFLRDGEYRLEFSADPGSKTYRSQATVQNSQRTGGLKLLVP